VTVSRGTAPGSALEELDFTRTTGTATIPAGSSSTTVNVPVVGETLNEADETFFVNLRSPTVATIADEQGVGTIVNDDPAPTAAPTIGSFSPTSGPTGTVVTVTGTNFTGTSTVTFNGKSATPKVQSATRLTVPAANGATTGKIAVTNVVGTGTSASSFTVTLSLVNFSPASGPVGTTVTVNGVGFNSSSIVVFKDGVAAPTTFVSPTQLQATVPPGAVPGGLRVTNTAAPLGTVQSRGNFTVM
jgi:hypothetical protein